MASWKVLQLSETPDGLPHLLVKFVVSPDNYKIFLTDLTYIWYEQLNLDGIVKHASEEESPIEVSNHDTAQLPILLESIAKPLQNSKGTMCHVVKATENEITLQTSATLPEPLDPLTWKFHMRKMPPTFLQNELIVPLLVSSLIQHQRVDSLITSIHHKDRVIAKLLDHIESSSVDLATVFPTAAGVKSSRKLVKREQAAKHVPGLAPFDKEGWRTESEHGTSRLFSFSDLLNGLQSEPPAAAVDLIDDANEGDSWWERVKIKSARRDPTTQKSAVAPSTSPPTQQHQQNSDEEFQTQHTPPRLRESRSRKADSSSESKAATGQIHPVDDDDETTDDEDFAEPTRPEHSLTPPPPSHKSLSRETTASPKPAAHTAPPKPKKGFVIGGKKATQDQGKGREAQTAEDLNNAHTEDITPRASVSASSETAGTPRKPSKKPFRIGGKAKAPQQETGAAETPSSPRTSSRDDTPAERPVPSNIVPGRRSKESTPADLAEETPEEKVERRRRELKRKNEELAQRQAHKKPKKKF